MRLFHGSMDQLAVGTVLRGRGDDYAKAWSSTDFYKVLEQNRPQAYLPHAQAVFAVSDPDDIDLAGGGTEWIFELEPTGPVSRHDLNWSSEISCLLSDGLRPDSVEVRNAAFNYWAGIPHPNESVWEYLIPEAKIILVEPYEDFQIDSSVFFQKWNRPKV